MQTTLESIESSLARLHTKYDRVESKIDHALLKLEQSRFSSFGIVIIAVTLIFLGVFIGKVI